MSCTLVDTTCIVLSPWNTNIWALLTVSRSLGGATQRQGAQSGGASTMLRENFTHGLGFVCSDLLAMVGLVCETPRTEFSVVHHMKMHCSAATWTWGGWAALQLHYIAFWCSPQPTALSCNLAAVLTSQQWYQISCEEPTASRSCNWSTSLHLGSYCKGVDASQLLGAHWPGSSKLQHFTLHQCRKQILWMMYHRTAYDTALHCIPISQHTKRKWHHIAEQEHMACHFTQHKQMCTQTLLSFTLHHFHTLPSGWHTLKASLHCTAHFCTRNHRTAHLFFTALNTCARNNHRDAKQHYVSSFLDTQYAEALRRS